MVVNTKQPSSIESGVLPVTSSQSALFWPPVMLHKRWRFADSSLRYPGGSGILSRIGQWNLRRLGSIVTIGLKVTLFGEPNSFITSPSGTGWAYKDKNRFVMSWGLMEAFGQNCFCRMQRDKTWSLLLQLRRTKSFWKRKIRVGGKTRKAPEKSE